MFDCPLNANQTVIKTIPRLFTGLNSDYVNEEKVCDNT